MVPHGELNVVLPELTLKEAEVGAPVRRPLSSLGATRPRVDLVRGTDVGEEGRRPLDNHQEAHAEKGDFGRQRLPKPRHHINCVKEADDDYDRL